MRVCGERHEREGVRGGSTLARANASPAHFASSSSSSSSPSSSPDRRASVLWARRERRRRSAGRTRVTAKGMHTSTAHAWAAQRGESKEERGKRRAVGWRGSGGRRGARCSAWRGGAGEAEAGRAPPAPPSPPSPPPPTPPRPLLEPPPAVAWRAWMGRKGAGEGGSG
eukprot:858174-Rhodomonas_salina.1